MNKNIWARTALSLAISVISGQALAADNVVEEVVITGQKIERTQMETVSSVMVIDSKLLLNTARTDNLFDVLDMAPNVSDTGGFNGLSIRGIASSGVNALNNGADTIGIFIDNSQVTARGVQDNAIGTWDVESIEILRGPQSTTGGRNSLAGQIIIHTKDPEFESNGAARLSYGEHGTAQASIMQTGAITDKLAFRITGDYQRTDGYVENDILNDDAFNRNNTSNVRLKLLYKMDNDGEVNFSLARNRYREHGDATVDGTVSGRKSRLNYPSRWDTESDSASLTVTLPFSDEWEFQSNTGFNTSDFFRSSDFDGSSTPAVNTALTPLGGPSIPLGTAILDQARDDYNFNQEFLLRFNNDKVRSVMGAYVARGKADDDYTVDNAYFLFSGLPLLLNNFATSTEEFTTYALFADVDYKLTDNFTLMAGLRVNHENRETQLSQGTSRAISYAPLTAGSLGLADAPAATPLDMYIDGVLVVFNGVDATRKDDKSSTVVLPKLGFNYQWNDDLSTGFVVQKGYRPGGVAVNLIRGGARSYDEETTINYEASLRWQATDSLNINANVFYTDWKDQQAQVVPAGAINPNDFWVDNLGESQVQGIEVSFDAMLTPDWDIYGGIGYTDTEIKEYEDVPAYKGREFQHARNLTANLGTSYSFADGWNANVNISHASEGAPRLDSLDTVTSAYTLVNAKLGYETEHWGVSLYANNLFDDEYELVRRTPSDYGNLVYADPRVVGISFTSKW